MTWTRHKYSVVCNLVFCLSNGKDIGKTFEIFFKLKMAKLISEISWPLAAPGDLSSKENILYLSPLQPLTAIPPPPPPQLTWEARGEPLREAKVERLCCSGFLLFLQWDVYFVISSSFFLLDHLVSVVAC